MCWDGDMCIVESIEDGSYLIICISKKDKSFVYCILQNDELVLASTKLGKGKLILAG